MGPLLYLVKCILPPVSSASSWPLSRKDLLTGEQGLSCGLASARCLCLAAIWLPPPMPLYSSRSGGGSLRISPFGNIIGYPTGTHTGVFNDG